jgi:hypothetical protein
VPAPSERAVATSGRATRPETTTARRTRRALPGTASNLPLIGLLGILSLAAGVTLRRFGSLR